MPYVDIGFTGLFFVSTWYHNILKPLTRIKIQICLAFRIHSPKELEEMYCMKSLTTTLILVKNQWLEINQWWYYKSDLTVNQNLIFFQSVLLNLRGPVERISQKKAEFHSRITRHRTICCPKKYSSVSLRDKYKHADCVWIDNWERRFHNTSICN